MAEIKLKSVENYLSSLNLVTNLRVERKYIYTPENIITWKTPCFLTRVSGNEKVMPREFPDNIHNF
jgi:hypothetical protein